MQEQLRGADEQALADPDVTAWDLTHMPTERRSRRRRPSLVTWGFWLAAIAIAVASSVAIVRLLDHADTRRRTQIVLAEISQAMSRLRLAEVRAVVEPDSEEPFRQAIDTASRASAEAVHDLLRLDPAGDAADRVREAVEQYRNNVRVHRELMGSEQWSSAWRWEGERSGPSFDLLQEAIAQSGIFYSAQATRSLRRVRLSAVVAIGSEALLIGLLVTLSARSRHAAARKLDEERLRHAARFEALVQHSADAIALLDSRTVVRYASSAAERVLGFRPEEAVGMSFLSFLESDSRTTMRAALQEVIESGGELLGLELPVRHEDGALRWIEVSASNLLEDPNVGGIVLNFRDVTQSRSLKEQLRHQAWHDSLTGLANRELFGQSMEKRLAQARRDETPCAVLYLDLDGFKAVNDTLGHDAGDELLAAVSERIQEALREHEMAARLGGDEFAVLLERAGRADAESVARRLLEALEPPFTLSTGTASVGVSIGIAVEGSGDDNPDELLRRADMAMYLAKTHGKNRYEVFRPGMSAASSPGLTSPADLEGALERREFVLQYQPVIHLGTGRLVGVEALVRWKPAGTSELLPPAEFLPLAEESGLILRLGQWILRSATRQVARWHQEYPSDTPLLLSLNLSARQLSDPQLLEELREALQDSGLEPSSLMVEVSEADLMKDAVASRRAFEGLRRIGVRLAIDDFGSGAANADCLRELTVDMVKIERQLIDHVTLGGTGSRLALHMIERARRRSLQTVAEGVELESQLAQVTAAGCDLAQGFSLARPLDPADLERLLDAEATVVRALPSTPRTSAASS